jgi:hypothetical protein
MSDVQDVCRQAKTTLLLHSAVLTIEGYGCIYVHSGLRFDGVAARSPNQRGSLNAKRYHKALDTSECCW